MAGLVLNIFLPAGDTGVTHRTCLRRMWDVGDSS